MPRRKKPYLICFIFIHFYDNEQELLELRLDEDYMHEDLKKELLVQYTSKFQSKALEQRVTLLLKTYDL